MTWAARDDDVVRLTICGHNLPGRRFCEGDDQRDNVHVGVQERRDPTGLVPGDAKAATWDVDVKVLHTEEGGLDFRGPAVQGKRGERFVYLTWGDVAVDGELDMFRRAKLMLDAGVTDLVRDAEGHGRALVASVDLTDRWGGPRCARLKSDALTWTLE